MKSMTFLPCRGASIAVLALFTLTACPSEPATESDASPTPEVEAVTPSGGDGAANTPSVLDDVEVMGADEAAELAEQEIDESNVLDALDDLEKEIGDN